MTTKSKVLSPTERYLQTAIEEAPEIVDVTAPSGFVFKFEKVSKTKMLFGFGELPQTLASGAVTDWTEAGLMKGLKAGNADTMKLVKAAFNMRQRVLDLSYSPKLVTGTADPDKDELSTDTVSSTDLDFLIQWVATGGETSPRLANFPPGPPPGPLVSPNRSQRRAANKQPGRTRAGKQARP